MKPYVVKDKGWKLLVQLFKTAKSDGSISFDEERILKASDQNVNNLLAYTQEAWKDRVLTEDEKQRIVFLIKKIQDDATTLAEYDDIITNEEEALLDIIREIIQEFCNQPRSL
ncbi:MAG: hypothetical protein ACW98K_08945 [Candidatus Kariarchaeaceae archaeon]|jgi:argininosuccinate lyase